MDRLLGKLTCAVVRQKEEKVLKKKSRMNKYTKHYQPKNAAQSLQGTVSYPRSTHSMCVLVWVMWRIKLM